jgi:glycine cleavage system protein P-like pyridoxal-binding family
VSYSPHTAADVAAMLAAIGVDSIDELFAHVPAKLRERARVDLPAGLSEPDLHRRLSTLAHRNGVGDGGAVFLGAGAYPHWIPAVVDQILRARIRHRVHAVPAGSEPGTLQAIFEFQTFTALPSPSTSRTRACTTPLRRRRKRCSWRGAAAGPPRGLAGPCAPSALPRHGRDLRPRPRRRPHTEIPFTAEGRTDIAALRAELGDDALCVVLGQPNVFGVVEDRPPRSPRRRQRARSPSARRPSRSHCARAPAGRVRRRHAVAEGQSFGLPVSYGGPGSGCSRSRATRPQHARTHRRETVDARGQRGYVLTLATREQHIRRERATSNICTNQGLCALAVTVYLSLLGRNGLRSLAEANYQAAHAAATRLEAAGVARLFPAPFFNEFVVQAPEAAAEWEALARDGVVAGFPLARWYPELDGALLVCVTEMHTAEQIDRLVAALATPRRRRARCEADVLDEPLIFERGSRGRTGWTLAAVEGAAPPLPADLRRDDDLAGFPEVGELETLRHFLRLSQWNYSAATTLYPLGSCTMKYNPVVNEVLARLPGMAALHPLVPDALAQGALELIESLETALAAVSGLDAVCLQPAAGAHGELLGMLLVRAYHVDRGGARRRVLIPSSAHGTNPASATLCGYEVRELPMNARGLLSAAAVAAAMDDSVAALMVTNPNTLGLFEEEIEDITAAVHAHGGQVYMDGANLNAIMGVAKPGDMGVDVMQFNLHKTFSTLARRWRTGAGPVAVVRRSRTIFPCRASCATATSGAGRTSAPKSVGRMRSFYGNSRHPPAPTRTSLGWAGRGSTRPRGWRCRT